MKITTLILSFISILVITSCEKLIEVDQPDIIEQEQAFSDKNSTRLSLMGIYGIMSELVEPMFLAGEVRADLVTATKSADADIKEFSNNSFSASNKYISPKPFYTIINNANDYINEFEGLVANNEMDSVDFIKYKAELVALRVWSQYQVAKIFGTCKYYTEVTNSDSSVIEEYSYEDTAFIGMLINDLTYSDTITFTSITEPVVWQTIRFSDFYVNALMGELYMDYGDYENAVDKFKEVTSFGDKLNRSSTRFKMTSPKFTHGYLWMYEFFESDWETSELMNVAVFMIAYDNKYNQTHELRNWTLSLNYQVAPSEWYENMFYEHATSDIDNNNLDWRYTSLYNTDYEVQTLTRNTIMKYRENDKPFIVMRTARLALLKAYCYNLDGDTRKALKELNDIRKRIPYLQIDDDKMPQDEMGAMLWLEDVIINEMAYETGFEGQRWYDLMRVANRRNDPSYLADKVSQKYSEESRDEIRAKLLDKTNWYIPVFE